MINFQLAREIYGLTPWMMDVHSIPVMSSVLSGFKSGVNLEKNEIKLNTPFVYEVSNDRKLIERPYQLRTEEQFEGIGVINIDGPITKSGGDSTLGMSQLSNIMTRLSKDSRIKSFVVLVDSGGGSSSAVQIMSDTIKEVRKTKRVIGVVSKGGMAASAAYGIISSCESIYCEDPMSIVGSVGTMIQFEGKKANSVDENGNKHIRLYATKSTKKNEGFEEALNNDNYKVIVNNLLDPINEDFINMISKNRPSLKKKDFDNGATFFAKDVIGTYIDGIKSFNLVVNSFFDTSVSQSKSEDKKLNTNTNINTMTKADFKAANPTAYNEILAEGAAKEKDRSGAWLAHVKTDVDSVVKGIDSGKDITQSEREAFFVKQNSMNIVSNIVSDSAEDVVTGESKTPKSKEEVKLENQKKEIDQAFDFELN